MSYKTSKKKPRAKARPSVAETVEPTAAERLAAAYATGNMTLVRQVRAELGQSAPIENRRDALIRTERKADKKAGKAARR